MATGDSGQVPGAGLTDRLADRLAGDRRAIALETVGFMPPDEGDALHAAALFAGRAQPGRPMVEVGSYCGRSTVWIGDAAQRCGTLLFAVDHHRGSEENQVGWEHHDPTLVDPASGLMDTLGIFRQTIHGARLDDTVVAVVGDSAAVAAAWSTPLSFVFIDGGHGVTPTQLDYRSWTPHVAVGGILAIHDVFADPADGGQAPHDYIYRPALDSGRFVETSATGSLRVLRRVSA